MLLIRGEKCGKDQSSRLQKGGNVHENVMRNLRIELQTGSNTKYLQSEQLKQNVFKVLEALSGKKAIWTKQHFFKPIVLSVPYQGTDLNKIEGWGEKKQQLLRCPIKWGGKARKKPQMWVPQGLSQDRERFVERCAQKLDVQSWHNWPYSLTESRV